MSPHAVVWWAVLAGAFVILVLIVLQLARAGRAAMRIERRIGGYGDLPIVAAIARAEANLARIEAAATQIEPLVVRAQAALAVIRRGPLPPEAVAAYRRIRGEIAAFRAALPRRPRP